MGIIVVLINTVSIINRYLLIVFLGGKFSIITKVIIIDGKVTLNIIHRIF